MRKGTNTYKVYAALVENGRTLTTAQISRLGVANPSRMIHSLREKGYNIVSTITTNRNGRQASYQYVAPKRRAAKGSV